MPVMPAVSVFPTWAVPLMAGAPVAGLLDAEAGPDLTQSDPSPGPASLRAVTRYSYPTPCSALSSV